MRYTASTQQTSAHCEDHILVYRVLLLALLLALLFLCGIVISFFEKKEGRFAPYRSLRGCARVLYLFLQVGAYSVNVVKTGVRSCVETASRVLFFGSFFFWF